MALSAAARSMLARPARGAGAIAAVTILAPATCAIVFAPSRVGGLVIFVAGASAVTIAIEMLFRVAYRVRFGGPYRPPERLPFDRLYIEPHPYLPFISKRHFMSQPRQRLYYPLHPGRFWAGQYTTNNLRFNNGPTGDRDIEIPKPRGLFRINCLGASTTGNYIEDDAGNVFSYPLELERALAERLDIPFEVNNCAQGGYNSADILVRFCLQVIDSEPDAVVIYHAYNDVRAYLTPGFDSDYSHARRNLGESWWKYQLAGRIPELPLRFASYLVNHWLPSNIRYSLLDEVARGELDPSIDPARGLATYERNLGQIIDLCSRNGADVVLSTFCHFLYPEIADDLVHRMYRSIVERENEVIRTLAREKGVALVDNAALVPAEAKYFVDSIHFTPEGMQLMAQNIAEGLLPIIARRTAQARLATR